jgi:hypothetical protein
MNIERFSSSWLRRILVSSQLLYVTIVDREYITVNTKALLKGTQECYA